MEVAAFLVGSTLRARQIQFVDSIEDDLILGPEATFDLNPPAIIDSKISFFSDGFIWIERISFEKHVGEFILNYGRAGDG